MPAAKQFTRVNTSELRFEMESKLGRSRAEMYFGLLTKFLSLKIGKHDFTKLCFKILEKENLHLHNRMMRSILRNSTLATTPPEKSVKGARCFQSLCRDFPLSPKKGRTPSARDRKFKDRPSPLGPNGKNHFTPCDVLTPRYLERQSPSELVSLGSRPPCSEEDGEEVEQTAASLFLNRKVPLTAPLGILEAIRLRREHLEAQPKAPVPLDDCQRSGTLPSTSSLMKRLERKMEIEGLNLSEDCANLLNTSLDVYLKRLIKPCLELAASRSVNWRVDRRHGQPSTPVRHMEKQGTPGPVTVLDFRVAMEVNPTLLGQDWPKKFEKVCFYASEDTDSNSFRR